MAEFVQRNIEEMLPELEHSRKLSIFSSEEIRAILKKRKRFEYKMQRRTKEKPVYLQYIQYEINVLELIKQRRQSRKIDGKHEDIEKPIILRIHKLFRIACFRFKQDVKLWLTYIDFTNKLKDKNKVSKIYTQLLQIHNKKPNLWIMAAKHEFEVNESVETSRQLFQRALRFLPLSKKLWIEYFKMELLCIEMIKKRKQLLGIDDDNDNNNESKSVEDTILSGKVAKVVIKNSIKQISDDPYLIESFVMIARDFDFAQHLVDFSYDCLKNNEVLMKKEESWDVLSRKHLIGETEIIKKCEETGQTADFSIADMEKEAETAYLNALEQINTEKMWNIYIKFCFDRLNLNSKFLNEERLERLNSAIEKAKKLFQLPLETYIKWIEALVRLLKVKDAANVIDESLKLYKNSAELWKYKLKFSIDQEISQTEIIKMFQNCLNNVAEKDSLPFWDLVLKWAVDSKYPEIENLFRDGCLKHREVSTALRIKYLNWSFQNGGSKKVKKVYQDFYQVPPFDLEFYMKYIELEKCFKKVDYSQINSVYEEALKHFGETNVGLWLDYIKYKHCYQTKNQPQEGSNIYWKALKTLDKSLIEQFIEKFNLYKIKLENNEINDVEME